MSVDFIDTNVFVYLFDDKSIAKQEIAQRIVLDSIVNGTGCISFQVIQETLKTITEKIRPPASAHDAEIFLSNYISVLLRVMPDETLYLKCLQIKSRFGFSFYDSLIIAAALRHGCTRLLSKDMQDSQRVETLTIVNPFK